ncbi:transcription repressor OFP17-like [Camellia sinensis]|uniref:transcription repressor OFP17-like n=1 Tax=Camellia sinensis TaxID=4442 RepID=UPI0010367F56|nr:transcription repressor OFP17-like [Camellia sinensis]
MKLKAALAFKCTNLLNPCRKILLIFKFKFKKPLFIRALCSCKTQSGTTRTTPRKLAKGLPSLFGLLRRSREMDRLKELKSFSDAGYHKAPFLSPLTPAYVRMSGADQKKGVLVQEDVEDACRSFENYLVEMIVDEGKVRDLADVEELLYCWKNLKCPVFVNLVCRFYGELCKDLFSNSEENVTTP